MGQLGVEVYAPVRAARRATCWQADDRATSGGGMVHDLVVTVALHRDDPVVEPQAHARPQHPLRVARGVEVRAGLVDPDGRYVGHRVAEACRRVEQVDDEEEVGRDRKSTRLKSSQYRDARMASSD